MLRKSLCVAVLAVVAVGGTAFGDGMLIPGPHTAVIPDVPNFSIKYHRVKCDISDQVSTTYVDQVFVNESGREIEATYIFPLPEGAVVQKFKLHADGQEIPARLLTKEEAQRIYEDIVRRRKDPAILTYAGKGAYQARIFPIPPRGERRIELTYSELLHYDNGVVGYLYPLSPEKLSHKPIDTVVFVADIQSKSAIGSVYSPTHEIDINRISEHHVRVSYEEQKTKPDRDVLLYYGVAKDPVGMSLIPFKEPNQDGFYLLLAAPAVEQDPGKVVAKNICFVLDTSGSMSGEKIQQARDALTFCVNSLNPQDRFDIVAFSDSVNDLANQLLPATPERVAEARKFISGLQARGGTDIDSALRTALKHRIAGELNYICFLTDGMPTIGETNTETILKNVTAQAEALANTPTRLFVFGVGYDVNTNFLDKVAQGHGGLTTYVRPTENIEVKVSNFYAKVAQPMLTDVGVHYGTVKTYDEFPRKLPELFYGSQIELFGRYKKETAGRTTVELSGTTSGGSKRFALEADFPEVRAGTEYIASLWAARKIGFLLDELRLRGDNKELIDEIVKLSLEYGILTEYTAFLAEEGRALAAPEMALRAGEAMRGGFAVGAGSAATSRAQNAQNMQMQSQVARNNMYLDAAGNWQRVANIQNVGQRGFVQRGARWEDTRYQPTQRIAMQVQAYSEAHFQLSRRFPALNSQLAVGDNVLVIVNDKVVEVGPQGKTTLTEDELRWLETGGEVRAEARPQPRSLAPPALLVATTFSFAAMGCRARRRGAASK